MINILAPGREDELDDIPSVNDETLRIYYEYLCKNLPRRILLTGRESVGYFSWEEKYEWGMGSASDYKKMRSEKGSSEEEYVLLGLSGFNVTEGVIANVFRKKDRKNFKIPLEDLEPVVQTSNGSELVEDYGMWFCNFSD